MSSVSLSSSPSHADEKYSDVHASDSRKHALKPTNSRTANSHADEGKNNALGDIISPSGLVLLFCLVFLPMLAIPFVLLGLVTWEKQDFPNNSTPGFSAPGLQIPNSVPSDSYYTHVSVGKFALVSSWASTIEGHISAPFLILFSFLVAWSLSPQRSGHQLLDRGTEPSDENYEKQIREVLHSRTHAKLWRLFRQWYVELFDPSKRHEATIVAILGVSLTLMNTGLIIAGDNWLHTTVQSETYRCYGPIQIPDPTKVTTKDSNDINSPLFQYAAGYGPTDECNDFLSGKSNLPCSLNNTNYYNIQNAWEAYLTLQAGISSNSTDFSQVDFTSAFRSQQQFTSISDQVVNHVDPATNLTHSFLFYLDAAFQGSDDDVSNYGYDYIAPTYSMQTTCSFADQPCKINPNNSTYDCSSIFKGNLSTEPSDGVFRIPGWNTTFYTIDNGAAQEIYTNSSLNPFYFNVTAQVDSLSSLLTPNSTLGPLIQTNQGNLAFALNCIGAVYNVNYSLVNGSIQGFAASLAPEDLASIVRAPLQVGYGRYNLYQSAISAVLAYLLPDPDFKTPVNESMAKAFSQVAVALSSGAFGYTVNVAQRQREDVSITRVPKAPVWFLAIVCGWYALSALIVFVIALFLRRKEHVPGIQRRLGLGNVNDIVNEHTKMYLGDEGEETAEKRHKSR